MVSSHGWIREIPPLVLLGKNFPEIFGVRVATIKKCLAPMLAHPREAGIGVTIA
jgi:hypothetical protein